MRIVVAGTEYTNFISASCDIRLDALSRSFSFTATAKQSEPLPFKAGDSCEITVSGEKVLTGFVEVVSVDYDASDHIITIQGRDKTADIVDSTLDAISDIKADNLTLKALIERIVEEVGADIKVVDEVSPEPFSAAEDVVSPEAGDNAFSFLEKYARKRQVLLTSDADGNIVIADNSGISAPGAVQHIIGADDNNVISSSYSHDITGRYNAYKFSSGLNPVALNLSGDFDLASLVNQSGGASDPEIRSTRQLVLSPEAPFSDTNAEARAKWEANVRKARGLIYSAEVSGYRVGDTRGALWQTNRVYQIVDDFIGKIEPMLCNSVSFTLDTDNGSRTRLGFVGRNAYTKLIESSPTAEVDSNVG